MDVALSRNGQHWLKARECTGFLERFLGWMGRSREGLGDQALWFPDCHSLQTTFMRFPLDIYFLDASHRVIRRSLGVPPFRFVFCASADSALEAPSGTVPTLEVGEKLECVRCG